MTEGDRPIDTIEIDPDARCRACGYLLRGLTERRCPECGREFDPDDPESYVRSGALTVRLVRRIRNLARFALGPDALGILLCLFSTAAVLIAATRPGLPLAIGTIIMLLLMSRLYRAAHRERRQQTISTIVRWTAASCLLLVFAASIRYDRCPHARYVGVGPFYVSFAGDGCRNPREMRTFLDRVFNRNDRWREYR